MAFTAYDSETEPILDPKIGKVVFKAYEWGPDPETGVFYSRRDEIPSHMCSREELGLDGESSQFLPIHSENVDEVSLYQRKFLCIEPKDMYIHGSYDSYTSRLLNVQLIKCNNETRVEKDCAPPEEITSFLRNKFFITLANQITFNPNNYGEESV